MTNLIVTWFPPEKSHDFHVFEKSWAAAKYIEKMEKCARFAIFLYNVQKVVNVANVENVPQTYGSHVYYLFHVLIVHRVRYVLL